MKILAIADYYSGNIESLAQPDAPEMVVTLGDLPESVYRDVALLYRQTPRLAVLGNHDRPYHAASARRFGFQPADLVIVRFNGLSFAGFDGSARYKEGEGYMWGQAEARARIRQLRAADVLLTHSPPYSVSHPANSPAHAGLTAPDDYLAAHRPQLMLCGHLHDPQVWQVGETEVRCIFGVELVELEKEAR